MRSADEGTPEPRGPRAAAEPGGSDPAAEPVLRVASVAAGGDGVAREPSGRVVFLPRTAPGDRVAVRIVEERGSWARGRAVALRAPGPERAPAPCPHYRRGCGGCQLQHLSPDGQAAAKRRIVADALERIGRLAVEVPAPIAAGPPFGYRNRITLTLERSAEGARAGYRRYDDPSALLDVDDCPLAEPPVRRAWAALRGGWGEGARALPGGDRLRVRLRASAEGEVALDVRGGAADRPGDPERVAGAIDRLAAYHWTPDGAPRRRLAGAPVLRERWAGLALRLRPAAFLQVNRAVSEAMDRHLDARAGALAGRRVLDLYAGVGTRAIRWALRGVEVHAVEVEEDAVETGREAAERHGAPVRFHAARVEDFLRRAPPADLVVVNPPRAGLSRPAARRLAAVRAGALAYVSCDPATLARDLRRLAAGWRVAGVQPFDPFPQTAHVETIAWLRPVMASEAS